MSLSVFSVFFKPVCVFPSGDWSEADRILVWLDLSEGCHPEGGWHLDCKGRHWSHCGVSRAWS